MNHLEFMDSTVKSSVGNNRGQAMAQKAEQSKIGENNQTSNNKSSNEMESRNDENSAKRRKMIKSWKIVNDPIWLTIELHPLCVMIIDTPQFQRLRSIKQMGGCFSVFPGACHTRFEHSIGTSHLAGVFGRELKTNITEPDIKITNKEILCLEVAGLCHDLGHGPFSHLFDQQFIRKARPNESWEHENASVGMIREIFKKIEQDYVEENEIDLIENLIKEQEGPTEYTKRIREKKPFLFEIIANKLNSIDVDKWDYFSRDCHMLGLHHNFQCERSIKLARVVKHEDWHISFPKSDYHHMLDMFYSRFTIHRRACLHPVVKAVEMMITDALLEADKHLKFPPGVAPNQQKCLSQSIDDMNAYLCVTDNVLHQIKEFGDSENQPEGIRKAQEIIKRIESRKLYKMIAEKRVIFGSSKDQMAITTSMKKRLLTDGKVDSSSFEIQVAVFSYGNDNKNPMDNVKLYEKVKSESKDEEKKTEDNVMDKNETLVSAEMKNTEKSCMLPASFEQMYIRLYWKWSEDDPSVTQIKDTFSKIKELQYDRTATVTLEDMSYDCDNREGEQICL